MKIDIINIAIGLCMAFIILLIYAGWFTGGVEQRYEAINYLNMG